MQLRLLIVQFQRDLQGAQFLRVQVQLGALLAVAVEHQHLLVQRLLPLRAAQLRVELRRRRCGHQCAGRSGRLRWAGGGGATAWLSVGGCCASLAGSGCAVLARSPLVGCGSAALALSPSVADVFACQRRAGMLMNARRFYHRPPRCSAGHCRAAAQSLRQRYPPAASVGLRPVALATIAAGSMAYSACSVAASSSLAAAIGGCAGLSPAAGASPSAPSAESASAETVWPGSRPPRSPKVASS